MVSDALGSWDCWIFCGWKWLQLKWVEPMAFSYFTVKELAPIVVAGAHHGFIVKAYIYKYT